MMTNPRYIPIWEQIAELTAQIPPEEFDKIPSDLSINLDHYLYGAQKELNFDAPIEVK